MSCTSFQRCVALSLALVVCGVAEAKKPPEMTGAVAASCGEAVVLINPAVGALHTIDTGPVGFLFPAPGGVLFAPDIINGRTTVYDVQKAQIREVLAGVTMPRFGPWKDRYLVIAGDLIVVSYPERSYILRMDGDFDRPWQVLQAPDTSAILLLERYPADGGSSRLSAIDLVSRNTVMQKNFTQDLTDFELLTGTGLMAVVDGTENRVRLLDPATFSDTAELETAGEPTDVAVVNGGRQLLVAGADGVLQMWEFKQSKKGLKTKLLDPILIEGRALKLAVSPDDRLVAVATDKNQVLIVDTKEKNGAILGSWPIQSEPRDLVWFDPTVRGPLLPSWSDQGGGPETMEKNEKW